VGGKRQLLNELTARLPRGINRYHEPFLGGGALFFELAHRGVFSKAFLSDLNRDLIEVYQAVKSGVEPLIRALEEHRYSEREYYRLRDAAPAQNRPARAARLIYLNKTCYNGLYRVNSQGRFNVPFGRYKNPLICDAPNLRLCSAALAKAAIRRQPFETVLAAAEKGDLIYFDPPYYPLSKTANFAAYQKTGFGEADHESLREVFLELHRRGCHVMLSNSHTPFTTALYRRLGAGIRMEEVNATRAVNSDSSRRGTVKEILVRNF
jgi:DNA adenine methylase